MNADRRRWVVSLLMAAFASTVATSKAEIVPEESDLQADSSLFELATGEIPKHAPNSDCSFDFRSASQRAYNKKRIIRWRFAMSEKLFGYGYYPKDPSRPATFADLPDKINLHTGYRYDWRDLGNMSNLTILKGCLPLTEASQLHVENGVRASDLLASRAPITWGTEPITYGGIAFSR